MDVGDVTKGEGLLSVIKKHRIFWSNSKHQSIGEAEQGRGGFGTDFICKEMNSENSLVFTAQQWLLLAINLNKITSSISINTEQTALA